MRIKIDKVFHEYIRRRDADEFGYCNCISCKKNIHFSESDAGHFISRKYLITRYDERNVRAQCRKCNRFEYGRQFEYSIALGQNLSQELLQISKSVIKYSDADWAEIHKKFTIKLNKIKKHQNF